MKTFKIIGLIALLIVLFEFIGGFNDGWSDVDKPAPKLPLSPHLPKR
jgi:hypothetical protein